MNWDWESIKAKASEFIDEADKKIKQYTPESWSKEKQFINASIIAMVLMTIADKKVETQEVLAVMEMIDNIKEIEELEMKQEAIELFTMHLERLQPILDNEVKFTVETAKLLGDIAKIKAYPEYVPMIKNIIDFVSNSDGASSDVENEMKQKILEAIS